MKFVSRSQWGAPPTEAPYIASTGGVKVHYLGSTYSSRLHSACADYVRRIRINHLANVKENYLDIAYNALVCEHGYVFEGRGAHRRTGANGNADLNRRDYAVCALLGARGMTQPTDTMLHGLVDAIEWLREDGGAGVRIAGHRDGIATECPGDALYDWLVKDGAKRPDGARPMGGIVLASSGTDTPVPRYQVFINGLAYGYGAHGGHVTAVGAALIKKGCGRHYRIGAGPNWTDADTRNYADWQHKLGYRGADADGVPGRSSLLRLLRRLPGRSTTASEAPPFPGRDFFQPGANNRYVTQLGHQLVAKGFGRHYRVGPGPRWSEADRLGTRDFQRSDRRLAGDADGYPGPLTWKLLFS